MLRGESGSDCDVKILLDDFRRQSVITINNGQMIVKKVDHGFDLCGQRQETKRYSLDKNLGVITHEFESIQIMRCPTGRQSNEC